MFCKKLQVQNFSIPIQDFSIPIPIQNFSIPIPIIFFFKYNQFQFRNWNWPSIPIPEYVHIFAEINIVEYFVKYLTRNALCWVVMHKQCLLELVHILNFKFLRFFKQRISVTVKMSCIYSSSARFWRISVLSIIFLLLIDKKCLTCLIAFDRYFFEFRTYSF